MFFYNFIHWNQTVPEWHPARFLRTFRNGNTGKKPRPERPQWREEENAGKAVVRCVCSEWWRWGRVWTCLLVFACSVAAMRVATGGRTRVQTIINKHKTDRNDKRRQNTVPIFMATQGRRTPPHAARTMPVVNASHEIARVEVEVFVEAIKGAAFYYAHVWYVNNARLERTFRMNCWGVADMRWK